jgi:hypothetical protein
MCAYVGWACFVEVCAPRWEVIHLVTDVSKFEIQTWYNVKSLCDDLLVSSNCITMQGCKLQTSWLQRKGMTVNEINPHTQGECKD